MWRRSSGLMPRPSSLMRMPTRQTRGRESFFKTLRAIVRRLSTRFRKDSRPLFVLLDADLDVAAAAEALDRVLTYRPQGNVQLHGIGVDDDRSRPARAADRRFLPRTAGLEIGDQVVHQFDQIDRPRLRPRRPREQHHVGDHLIDPHRLRADQGQCAASLRVGFFVKK